MNKETVPKLKVLQDQLEELEYQQKRNYIDLDAILDVARLTPKVIGNAEANVRVMHNRIYNLKKEIEENEK